LRAGLLVILFRAGIVTPPFIFFTPYAISRHDCYTPLRRLILPLLCFSPFTPYYLLLRRFAGFATLALFHCAFEATPRRCPLAVALYFAFIAVDRRQAAWAMLQLLPAGRAASHASPS